MLQHEATRKKQAGVGEVAEAGERAGAERVRAVIGEDPRSGHLFVFRSRRQAQSVPLLTELRQKLRRWKEQLLPQHPMAEAGNYTLGQWTELIGAPSRDVIFTSCATESNNAAIAAALRATGVPPSGTSARPRWNIRRC